LGHPKKCHGRELANGRWIVHFGGVTLLKRTLRDLKILGIFPSKGLGQNFLVDGTVVESLVSAFEVRNSDRVVEIGPGLGVISGKILAAGAELFAVEIDGRLSSFLVEKFSGCENFHLQCGDAVEFPLAGFPTESGNFRVIANIPYSISSPWMDAVLTQCNIHNLPWRMDLIVQDDIARRFFARVKSREFGPISIFLQSAYEVVSVLGIPSSSFYPRPMVSSVILSMVPKEKAFIFRAETKRAIRCVFTKRRKQIGGIVKGECAELQMWLRETEIPPTARPEEISVEEWRALDGFF
jgi:16S rRNA (adenine1518-N6/adenine1519-N6)-dimethyltransferase